MPVRSLNSSVLKWPDKETVVYSLLEWVKEITQNRNDIVKIGYFGSYARGDWGVGSDLDIIIIVKKSDIPFNNRSAEWDTKGIPIPVDLLVYTVEEYENMKAMNSGFSKSIEKEVVWIYPL
ncbi:nucleotidyltransferase domain-containing protein [Thermosediminibacter oceani]|uniref:DNA polymerase beta domain protein region n=1 Tax=Thermosediminibacter oceani (strain ATCC BAA-1034 / DSM 16646 / JW/IW-1228P) TaxID=555079 RepID=D9S1M1_THEOJ|nr:nucleotidyltransferase domain-containing protein [Thermosediminibacter oceani]ADL07298.1 DNA polymerase beta domain protein region [Thermosediminibacter oceani DSM 16646]